jgi:hypothetical protein
MQSALESEMSFLLADTQEIITARGLSRRSEIPASLLNGLRSNFRTFSECALIDNANYLDFDSAIPRFESWHPSQPVRSLRCDFRVCESRRHSGDARCLRAPASPRNPVRKATLDSGVRYRPPAEAFTRPRPHPPRIRGRVSLPASSLRLPRLCKAYAKLPAARRQRRAGRCWRLERRTRSDFLEESLIIYDASGPVRAR